MGKSGGRTALLICFGILVFLAVFYVTSHLGGCKEGRELDRPGTIEKKESTHRVLPDSALQHPKSEEPGTEGGTKGDRPQQPQQ
jgi:hypothetical protein